MNKIVSNCTLCGQHSLHVIGEDDTEVMQCINCGYVSSSKFVGDGKDEEYKKLTDDMKRWSIEKDDRIWIPTVLTLPIGMLYPFDEEEVVGDGTQTLMKWKFAPMIEISKEEQEKYPNPSGGYYEKRIDTDNPTIYDKFVDGMVFVNETMKNSMNSNGK
jgi:Zn ribbon nucleic-acid-binding protein